MFKQFYSKSNKSLLLLYIIAVLLVIQLIITLTWHFDVLSKKTIVTYDFPINVSNNMKTIKETMNPLYSNAFPDIKEDAEKKEEVKKEFIFAWEKYKQYAWGKDFLLPISKSGQNVFNGALTIVDSMDTLLIMGMKEEYELCREWVEKKYKFSGNYSVFEIIIRLLGSFISLFQTTQDKLYLDKAIEIGDKILPLCDDKTGMYPQHAIFKSDDEKTVPRRSNSYTTFLADIGTMQMEFYTLSMLTDDPKYAYAANKIYKTLFKMYSDKELYPNSLNYKNGHQLGGERDFDTTADSFYEYLIKIYIMTNGSQDVLLEKYLKAVDILENSLLRDFEEKGEKYKYPSKSRGNSITHLVTFVSGMLAVGTVKKNPKSKEHLELAKEFAKTFYHFYRRSKTGLMSECLSITKTGVSYCDSKYHLRPETVESLYVLYRFTGDEQYRSQVWEIFKSIRKTCKNENGYASVGNVNSDAPYHHDLMDSYFLAETLKYIYLTFCSSETLPTYKYVFNTEAHPFRIWTQEETDKMKDIIGLYNK